MTALAAIAAVGVVQVVLFLVLVAIVVVIALVVVGRETARLAAVARPAVFDVTEATDYIADRLSPGAQGRLSHDDVRWILLADVDALEVATSDPTEGRYPWSRPEVSPEDEADQTVDDDDAVARLLALADAADRDLEDADIAEVLDRRSDYLEAIGAIGSTVDDDPAADGR